jgi:glutamate/tyrosine decarboxylase-like PLP-dependent enzyme
MTHHALDRATFHAKRHLDQVEDAPVAPGVSRETLLSRFDIPLGSAGLPAAQVIDDLANAAEGGIVSNVGGRFFAWVIGGTLPSALAAEWLTAAWDQNAAIYATSPVSSVIEEVAGKWLLDILHLPSSASFAFTTGCQMAHFVGILSARDHVLRAAGWEVGTEGLAGSPPIRVLVSAVRHVSLDRALRYAGIGARQIVVLPTQSDGSIAPAVLEQALRSGDGPTMVGLNAADLNTAAFDDFRTLIPLAKAHGAWVHVDGAFGLFARASQQHSALTEGIELADSWATDCHKWLNVPQDCGFAVVRHPEAHRRAFTIHDSYFVAEQDARDQIDWTPEWSRRARSVATYAALRELGRDGVADMIDRCCECCAALVDGIGALPGAEIVSPARLNQGLVRFLDPHTGATSEDHDARTDQVIAQINRRGEAMFGPVTWRGRRAMRVCVVNWQTDAAAVARTVHAVRDALATGV